MRNSFWARWQLEYLHHLLQLNKWQNISPNLKKDDVVLLKDEFIPPGQWPLDRVVDIHPGKDELVRVVSLKTAKSQFVRPVVKLVRLPVDDAIEDLAKQNATSNSSTLQLRSRTASRKPLNYILFAHFFLASISSIIVCFKIN